MFPETQRKKDPFIKLSPISLEFVTAYSDIGWFEDEKATFVVVNKSKVEEGACERLS